MNRGAAAGKRRLLEILERFFLRRDHRDLVTLGARRLEDQEGKPTVAGNEPELHSSATSSSVRRAGRRRITPRRELRMKSTR